MGKKIVYAATPEAKKKLEAGYAPCNSAKGCACGKPSAKQPKKTEPVHEQPAENREENV